MGDFEGGEKTDIERKIILVIVLGLIASLGMIVFAVTQFNYTVHNQVNVLTVGVIVEDVNGLPITALSWGSIQAGSYAQKTVYIRNNGTASVTVSMVATNWTPVGAEGFVTVSWDLEGSTVNAASRQPAIVTCTIDSGITGISECTFETVFTGTQI